MPKTMGLDIVSVEAKIFSDQISHLSVTGILGELGIYPGHAPLLTSIKPGFIRIIRLGEEEELFYISGGIMEVQPHLISILADTVVRAAELDENAALEAKHRAERVLSEKHQLGIDYAKVTAELAQAIAQLQALSKIKKKIHGNRH